MFATFSTSTLDHYEEGSPRPKRRQVLRACEACRIKRSKCDDSTPCAACVSRNWVCSRSGSGSDDPKSLAAALMQISSLREKIRVLEEVHSQGAVVSPPSSNADTSSSLDVVEWKEVIEKRRLLWPEKPVHFLRNGEYSYFGSFSPDRLITRIKAYWEHFPETISRFIEPAVLQSLPTSCRQPPDLTEPNIVGGGLILESEIISRTQQRQYIRQFWDLHHPLVPIICEKDFTDYFESLWVSSTTQSKQRTRAPSALADIVIAVCALAKSSISKQSLGQQAQQVLLPGGCNLEELTDAGISVWHYRRCQRLIDDELDRPTTFTVQAQTLMSIYLHTISRVSAAYNVLGTAVRIAYSLGLHRDPPLVLDLSKRELRRRIWWSLYILDSKLSMELGRPMIIDLNTSDCQLPADDSETAQLACLQSYFSTSKTTWLTYTVHSARLCTIVQSIAAEIYNDDSHGSHGPCHSSNTANPQTPLDRNPPAEHLEKKLHAIQAWLTTIPNDLRLSRGGEKKGPSVEVSGLFLDLYAPRWMQNQRIFLEIEYHNAVMTLIQPLMPISTPTESNGVIRLLEAKLTEHANAIIQICHQCSLETDIFSEHPELSSVVWAAALALLYRYSVDPEADKRSPQSLCLVSEILENVDSIDPTALEVMTRVRQLQQQQRSEWKQTANDLPLGNGTDIEPLIVPPQSSTISESVQLNVPLDLTQSGAVWDPNFWLSISRQGE